MKTFNEMTHAYIAAKFYVHLTEKFGPRGEKAFIQGTQRHAEQRGRRMAQRAIRRGEELDFTAYTRNGEWVNTEEIKALGCANQMVPSIGEDYTLNIYCCPWHQQFKNMGLTHAGDVYCQHLDNSIARGFNPYLTYDVLQTLQNSDHCIHHLRNAGITADTNLAKYPEGLKSFEYHCANSYWAYSEVSQAIFGAEGKTVAEQVMADFRADYGDEMADTLLTYEKTNFDVTDC